MGEAPIVAGGGMSCPPAVVRVSAGPRRARLATAVRWASSVLVSVLVGGCDDGGARASAIGAVTVRTTPAVAIAAPAAAAPVPAAIVDSARPMAIARFQSGLPRPRVLSNAAPSREALVRSLLNALRRQDTAAIADLFISRSEFAYLYFPSSPVARPPYELDPALAWFQLSAESERGIRKTLSVLGGQSATYEAHSCTPDRSAAGSPRIWRGCTLRWRDTHGAASEGSLFAAIIEYRGRFKFFSYATTL